MSGSTTQGVEQCSLKATISSHAHVQYVRLTLATPLSRRVKITATAFVFFFFVGYFTTLSICKDYTEYNGRMIDELERSSHSIIEVLSLNVPG
jgi:hypothetical protein